MDSIEARLPDQRHITGIRCLEAPREEGRDCIPADYTHIHQRAVVYRHSSSGRESTAHSTRGVFEGSGQASSRGIGSAKREREEKEKLAGSGSGSSSSGSKQTKLEDVPERILNRGVEGGMAAWWPVRFCGLLVVVQLSRLGELASAVLEDVMAARVVEGFTVAPRYGRTLESGSQYSISSRLGLHSASSKPSVRKPCGQALVDLGPRATAQQGDCW